MDAPEVVSGPQRSISYMLRRQPKLQIPAPVYPSPRSNESSGTVGSNGSNGSNGSSSMYEFYTSKSEDEKEAATPTRPQSTTILGVRRKRLIIGLLLVIIILVATIGGGVGGSLAAANARRVSESTPMIVMMPTTVTMTPSGGSPSPTSTPTPAPEPQTAASAAIIKVPTQGIIDFDCSRISMNRQAVTLGTLSWGFDVSCMMAYIGPGVDLAGMTAYTFGDCLRACAMFNMFARNNTCVGVFFNANLTTSLPMFNGNCFLKSYLPQMSPVRDLAAAASLGSSPQLT